MKYVAVHSTPLSFLKYVTAEGKTKNALVSGLNCSSDVGAAYEEMKFQFEAFTSERFYKKTLSSETEFNRKEEIRMHHYIQSFAPGEVTAEEAHRIGLEWAKAVFGNNRSVIVSTHIDREHIHNHFAAAAFDMDGKRWYGNKTTLKMCRDISDKIAKAHGISVIEKPRYRAKQKYGEYKACLGGYSWKRKLCDDIDNAVLRADSIDDLLKQLEAQGYEIRKGKYISVKVRRDRRPIRTYRLGDGYSLEHLEYRIRNKNMEMPLSEVLKYEGIQREWAMCIRQLQMEISRKPENDRLRIATY
ncbi:MAG: relaxase/mobilization nuclease domain-containing protein, partial [Ruminococcus sp.]|nr:relaxase/mobilization nuclease domain-containing protein [Ruminococcus sp.]